MGQGAGPSDGLPWYRRRGTAIAALLLVGPFGLPLVWMCPAFSLRTRIVLTAATLVLTVVSLRFTSTLLELLETQIETLRELQAL